MISLRTIRNYTILTLNGTYTVSDLTQNGNNYVSAAQVDTGEWSPVFKLTAKDEDGNITEEMPYAKLLQQVQYAWDGNKWYLAFAPVTEQEIVHAQQQANIEYIAMMTDVDLDE